MAKPLGWKQTKSSNKIILKRAKEGEHIKRNKEKIKRIKELKN